MELVPEEEDLRSNHRVASPAVPDTFMASAQCQSGMYATQCYNQGTNSLRLDSDRPINACLLALTVLPRLLRPVHSASLGVGPS